jgi:hypothetical protein
MLIDDPRVMQHLATVKQPLTEFRVLDILNCGAIRRQPERRRRSRLRENREDRLHRSHPKGDMQAPSGIPSANAH